MIGTIFTVLGILLGLILLLLSLVLFCKTTVVLRYEEQFTLQLRFLFIRYTVFPRKPKKDQGKRKVERAALKTTEAVTDAEETVDGTKAKQPEKKKKKKSDLGIGDFISIIQIVVSKFLRKIICRELKLQFRIGGDDAAEIAQSYGKISGVVYMLAGALHHANQLLRADIRITPDFTALSSEYTGSAIFYTRLIHALHCIFLIFKLL